jgi:hypothetical protein
MIDYPGMIIPVHSAVDPILDPADKEYIPANSKDAEVHALCKATLNESKSEKKLLLMLDPDKPEDYAGAPITVQLVCRRYREEECIGLTAVIAKALKGKKPSYGIKESNGTK